MQKYEYLENGVWSYMYLQYYGKYNLKIFITDWQHAGILKKVMKKEKISLIKILHKEARSKLHLQFFISFNSCKVSWPVEWSVWIQIMVQKTNPSFSRKFVHVNASKHFFQPRTPSSIFWSKYATDWNY